MIVIGDVGRKTGNDGPLVVALAICTRKWSAAVKERGRNAATAILLYCHDLRL